MRKLALLGLVVLLAAFAVPMSAQTTGTGTVGVTATITGSLSLVFNTGTGITLGGTGTNAATIAFGNVQAFGGSVPAGVTKTATGSDFTLSTPFNVNVSVANVSSANYSLAAVLNAADATNTWILATKNISSSQTLIASGTYGANTPITLALTVPFSNTTGSISNTINFTATAN